MNRLTLTHVTLVTGHERESPRAEVPDEVIAELRPLLTRALKGERVPLPGSPGYTMSGGVQNECCVVTLWLQWPEAAGPDPVPVLMTGVAAGDDGAQRVWEAIHSAVGEPAPDAAPPPPWCAAAIMPAVAMSLSDIGWFGDLERCLAWTWIDLQRV